MTPLIKSTDGSVWVEARVSDRCFYMNCEDGSRVPFSIEEIQDGMLLFNNGCECVNPSECQLIERPFQYGDDVEIKVSGRWMKAKYTGQGLQKAYAACRALRHSSPLLRPVGGV